ncbi:MAG: hypothetical protein R3D78_01010 [Paracoccaceae bacterium]
MAVAVGLEIIEDFAHRDSRRARIGARANVHIRAIEDIDELRHILHVPRRADGNRVNAIGFDRSGRPDGCGGSIQFNSGYRFDTVNPVRIGTDCGRSGGQLEHRQPAVCLQHWREEPMDRCDILIAGAISFRPSINRRAIQAIDGCGGTLNSERSI